MTVTNAPSPQLQQALERRLEDPEVRAGYENAKTARRIEDALDRRGAALLVRIGCSTPAVAS